jgi:Ca2+-binding RTX toxin-like protein
MNISNAFINSMLSQAVYANNLNSAQGGDSLISQLAKSGESGGAGMTSSQAEYFANNFRVIEQQETTASGFSATLFERLNESGQGSGEYFLSMRGSDEYFDFVDANWQNIVDAVSRDQVVDMLNFYLRLTGSGSVDQYRLEIRGSATPPSQHYYIHAEGTPPMYGYLTKVGTVIGDDVISSTVPLTLTGHSLGGHLASEFALLFPDNVADTTTFNSAGFIGWANNEVNTFNTMLADSLPEITSIRQYGSLIDTVTDITAPLDLVSNLGSHLGVATNQFEIQVESVPGPLDTLSNIRANHSIDLLSDSLAVINFMYTLDNSITIEKANVILQQSANQMNLSLEGLMSHFAELFNASPVTVTDSNHDSIYEVIDQITSAVGFMPNQFVIEPVDSDLLTLAQGGVQAALYTLIKAQPFVIRGVDQATTDSLYSATGDDLDLANYTEQYLQDRAQYLTHLLQYNTNDGEPTSNSPNISTLESYTDAIVGDTIVSFNSTSGQPVVISDELATTLGVDADGYRYTIFDNDEDNDQLNGKDQNDHIYGAGGDDTLDGGKGNDYLVLLSRVLRFPVLVHPARQGGVGNDTYRFDGGDGCERIVNKNSNINKELMLQLKRTA